MAIDVTNLVKSLGITLSSTGQNRPTDYVSNQGGKAVKPPSGVGAFAHNALSSIGSVAGQAANGATLGLAKNFVDVAKGITQVLPGIGTAARNQSSFESRTRQFDIDSARKTFTKQFSEGKITKERYHKLINDLIGEQQSISDELQANASKDYVSRSDFAKGLGTAGTLPLAGGRLVNAGIAAKAPLLASATSRSLPAAAAIAPLKAAGYASSADSAVQLPGQIKKGDYAGAGVNAALLASPLLLAGGAKVLPKIGKAASEAVYGRGAGPINSFFGENVVASAITKNPALQKVLKQAEDFTNSQPLVQRGMPANEFFKNHLEEALGLTRGNTSVEEFASRFQKYATQVEKLDKLKAAGKVDPKYVLTADYKTTAAAAVKRLGDFEKVQGEAKAKLAKEVAEGVAGGNPTAVDKIENVIWNSKTVEEVKQGLSGLNKLAGQEKVPGFTPARGFMLTFGPKNQASLPALKGVTGELQAGKDPLPGIGAFGKLLQRAGVSTESQNPAVYAKYRMNLHDELGKLGLDGKQIEAQLQEATQKIKGIFDERQLTAAQFKNVLGLESTSQAKQVRGAILRAYDRMTFGDLSAAGKLENALYKSSAYGQYRRIQGILRYEMNPFFGAQQAVEGELLSQNVAKGKALNLPGTAALRQIFQTKSYDELENIAGKLSKHLGEGYSATGATDTGIGLISAKLTKNQKQSLGGLVKTLAERQGKSVDDFLETADEKVLNNIRSIVQYPKQGFTSSNFAKTFNLFLFPSRYTTKLAGIAGKALVDMPPVMQVGTLKGIANFNDFLQSDEGIKWQSDNSEVIGLVNYLNPFNNVNKVIGALQGNGTDLTDFGLIGGLPLGVFTQILKTQTGIGAGSAYQNPKTGEIYPDQIPANKAGAIKLLLADVINSMYSYSGRTFGLPTSKREITQTVSGGLLKTQKEDTKASGQGITARQQRVQNVLSSGKSSATPKVAPRIKKETSYNLNSLVGTPKNTTLPAPATKKPKRAKPKAFRPKPV